MLLIGRAFVFLDFFDMLGVEVEGWGREWGWGGDEPYRETFQGKEIRMISSQEGSREFSFF